MVSLNATRKPLISVVIATRNEVKHIGNIIASLQSQTYSQLEVIVVDNSTDTETQRIAKAKGARVYDLSSKLTKIKGIKNYRGYQVNYGVKHAKGEMIFFPDADMTFDNNLLEEIASLFDKYDALYIPETMMGKGLFGKVRNFERSFYDQTVIDAVRVIKKGLYEKVGGYDEKNIVFGADDWDLTKTIKLHTDKIGITKSRLYHHEELLDWKTFIEKKRKYVNCFDGYVAKWGKEDADVTRQLGIKYRAFEVFLNNDNWLKLVKHPILTMGIVMVRFLTWLDYKKH